MALGAVFFSLPAALIGAMYLSLTRGLGLVETLGVYTAFGSLALLSVFVIALLADIARG